MTEPTSWKTVVHQVLGMSLLLLTGCSSFYTPSYNGPSSLQFSPIPTELRMGPTLPEGPLGFISPLEFKFDLNWPVDKARLTRGFMPHKKPRPHFGLDLAAPRGTPIFAALGGRVIYAGSGFRGFGRFVIIEHEDDWATFYGHLDKILIKQGEILSKGQLIGHMGRTGRATGTHLHFELRRERKALDPIAFLPLASEWVSKKN